MAVTSGFLMSYCMSFRSLMYVLSVAIHSRSTYSRCFEFFARFRHFRTSFLTLKYLKMSTAELHFSLKSLNPFIFYRGVLSVKLLPVPPNQRLDVCKGLELALFIAISEGRVLPRQRALVLEYALLRLHQLPVLVILSGALQLPDVDMQSLDFFFAACDINQQGRILPGKPHRLLLLTR